MLFKLSIKIIVLVLELALGFYSIAISDSLLVKFIFFAVSAVIIAFLVTKLTTTLLPIDKDYISSEQEEDKDIIIK